MRQLVAMYACVVGVVRFHHLVTFVDAACATVSSSGKCASCTGGTFGELCARNFSNKSAYSLLLPELIILSLLILLFVVMWAVFVWYVVWGWDRPGKEDTSPGQASKTSTTFPAEEPLPEVVTENPSQQQQEKPYSQTHPSSQPEQYAQVSNKVSKTGDEDNDGSPQSLRVSDGAAGNHQATPHGGVRSAPEPQMMQRTPERPIHRDAPVQSANTPISPSPIQPRSRQQDTYTPPRRDDSPPRRAPSHVYNPQQQQYRSIDPLTRHGDSNPFANELQRNLSPTRARASRAVAAPPTETTPGSHCPYGSSSQGHTNQDVDSPYRHAHHPHAHDDIARGGVRGPYSDTRVDAVRRQEAYDPHRPPADTKVDLTQHTQGGSRNGPPGGGTQRSGNTNNNYGNSIHQSPRDVNYRSQTASPNAPRSQQQLNDSNSQQQQYIINDANTNNVQRSAIHTQSSHISYPPPRVAEQAPAPSDTSQFQMQRDGSRKLFGGDQQQVSTPPSAGSSAHNYPTNDRRSNNASSDQPPPTNSLRRSVHQGGGNNNPPSTLYGGSTHADSPAAAALSQWPAVPTQTFTPTSDPFTAQQNQIQSRQNVSRVDQGNQQQGYASKKPAPLAEDEVYPNVPTDPTFMNGLSRRSRSRGPGGGRRKSVGEEDDYAPTTGGYGSGQQQQYPPQQQQQVYQDPNQRSINHNIAIQDTGLNKSANISGVDMTRRYPAEQQQPPTPFNPSVRAASVHFPPEATTPTSRNYSQNNSRQQQNAGHNNNRSDSNMSTFGDNPRQRGRMSVFPAPPRMEPNSSRAESHYDLPSSRSQSHF